MKLDFKKIKAQAEGFYLERENQKLEQEKIKILSEQHMEDLIDLFSTLFDELNPVLSENGKKISANIADYTISMTLLNIGKLKSTGIPNNIDLVFQKNKGSEISAMYVFEDTTNYKLLEIDKKNYSYLIRTKNGNHNISFVDLHQVFQQLIDH